MAGKDIEWVRAPQPTGSLCERIGRVIYNSEDKSCFGRTAKRWGIVITFYLVFYAVLALLFAVCMGGLMMTLDDTKPTYTVEYSLIGASPGMTHRPIPVPGPILNYNTSIDFNNFTYIEQLEEFFEVYKGDRWYLLKSACNSVDNYGFPETPCFFIKINRIFGWTPDYYDSEYLPDEMPADLVDHITSLEIYETKQVWISCTEEDSNLTIIEYPWGRGLSGNFYPYLNQQGYKSPIVAVKLTPPVNKLVKIRCRAWAKNIIYNKSLKDASGYTLLQLLVEENYTNDTSV